MRDLEELRIPPEIRHYLLGRARAAILREIPKRRGGDPLAGTPRGIRSEGYDPESGRSAADRHGGIPDGAADLLSRPLGLFVTLRSGSDLRGCIGRFAGTLPLDAFFDATAADAALHDYRFPPVALEEMAAIRIELSLLSRDNPVPSYTDIILDRHGIILEYADRRAVFLPEVPAEQGWNLETTLGFLARKAGLDSDAWTRPGAKFRVFTSLHFGEPREHEHG